MNTNKNYKKGVAVFIAVVAISALLLIALAISDISYKEQIISFSGRDSRVAFYAADAGVECALFHDLKGGNDGLFKFPVNLGDPTTDFKCADTLTNHFVNENSGIVTTTFYFNLLPSPELPKSCAIVRVSKTDLGGGNFGTKIESRGYNNNCENNGPTQNPTIADGPRNLERSFEVTY